MGEVSNRTAEMQEDSPPKTTTQHSHTSGSKHGDEQDEDAHVEKDTKMQDAREILEDESEDVSPETSQGMGDPDDEEEGDQSMFNFDVEPLEDEDEEREDDANEERNVQEDRQTPEHLKTNPKADAAKDTTKPSTNTAATLSPEELEVLKQRKPL